MTRRTHLRFAGLQHRSLAAYHLALKRFLAFAKQSHFSLRNTSDLDFTLSEYFNSMYQEGDPVSAAGHTLSGLKRFLPELRLQLPLASQYFRNWQRVHKPIRAIPISWELLQAMAAVAWEQGSPSTALMLYVGFNCFLRTSEMLALQMCHLIPHHVKHEVAVVIPFSKTSNGNAQVLTIKDRNIWLLTRSQKRGKSSTALLWAGTPHQFRSVWKTALECLEFDANDYSPYGVRRGGATWFFLQTASLDATLARGRWGATKVARQYIDDGTLTLATQRWTGQQHANVRYWMRKNKRRWLSLA